MGTFDFFRHLHIAVYQTTGLKVLPIEQLNRNIKYNEGCRIRIALSKRSQHYTILLVLT